MDIAIVPILQFINQPAIGVALISIWLYHHEKRDKDWKVFDLQWKKDHSHNQKLINKIGSYIERVASEEYKQKKDRIEEVLSMACNWTLDYCIYLKQYFKEEATAKKTQEEITKEVFVYANEFLIKQWTMVSNKGYVVEANILKEVGHILMPTLKEELDNIITVFKSKLNGEKQRTVERLIDAFETINLNQGERYFKKIAYSTA